MSGKVSRMGVLIADRGRQVYVYEKSDEQMKREEAAILEGERDRRESESNWRAVNRNLIICVVLAALTAALQIFRAIGV